MAGLPGTKAAAVAGLSVDPVVQPLGHREELGVAADHEPADIDVQVLDVPDERLEHLRHAAADGRRVDIPDRPAGESLPEAGRRLNQFRQPLGTDDGLEYCDR